MKQKTQHNTQSKKLALISFSSQSKNATHKVKAFLVSYFIKSVQYIYNIQKPFNMTTNATTIQFPVGTPPLVQKLYTYLENNGKFANWTEDGMSFKIQNLEGLVKALGYKHWDSCRIVLYAKGFKNTRCTTDGKLVYQHVYFKQGKLDDLSRIKNHVARRLPETTRGGPNAQIELNEKNSDTIGPKKQIKITLNENDPKTIGPNADIELYKNDLETIGPNAQVALNGIEQSDDQNEEDVPAPNDERQYEEKANAPVNIIPAPNDELNHEENADAPAYVPAPNEEFQHEVNADNVPAQDDEFQHGEDAPDNVSAPNDEYQYTHGTPQAIGPNAQVAVNEIEQTYVQEEDVLVNVPAPDDEDAPVNAPAPDNEYQYMYQMIEQIRQRDSAQNEEVVRLRQRDVLRNEQAQQLEEQVRQFKQVIQEQDNEQTLQYEEQARLHKEQARLHEEQARLHGEQARLHEEQVRQREEQEQRHEEQARHRRQKVERFLQRMRQQIEDRDGEH